MLYTFKELTSAEEMLEHTTLLRQLTKELTEERYAQLLPAMLENNYKQVAVYDGKACIAISGYWVGTKLYSGKYMEMDNVVVDKKYRSKGIGKLLCNWCVNKAKELNCEKIMLDAYLENEMAHRFYLREGFIKRGFHFLKNV